MFLYGRTASNALRKYHVARYVHSREHRRYRGTYLMAAMMGQATLDATLLQSTLRRRPAPFYLMCLPGCRCACETNCTLVAPYLTCTSAG